MMRLALIVLLLFALPAAAQDVCGASDACSDESSNVEYIGCLNRLAEEQDAELNTLYGQVRKLLAELDETDTPAPKLSPAFRKAQRNWVAFRDAQCETEYNVAQGGTAAGGYNADCLCNLTYHRNQDLRRMLRDYAAQ